MQDPDAFTSGLEAEQQELRDKLTAATARLKQVRSLTPPELQLFAGTTK